MMAVLNAVLGLDAISWNVFLAAMIAMMLDLDMGNTRVAKGSPLGHSLGCGLVFVYLVGIAAFGSIVFFGVLPLVAIQFTLGVGIGVLGHFIADLATGRVVYTFPRNLDLPGWFTNFDHGSSRFWGAWGRISIGNRALPDSYLNMFSVGLALVSIGMG
jgi:hypothetical protein